MSDTTIPALRRALGEENWHRLAPVIRRHYDIPAERNASKELRGIMEEVSYAKSVKPWLMAARIFRALVPCSGRDIPVTVRNWSRKHEPHRLFWHRRFQFPGGRDVVFCSHMESGEEREIIEFVRFGMGIRMHVSVEDDGALVFTGRDHCLRIGGRLISIPNWVMLGEARVVESAISEEELRVDFIIDHPLWGRTFTYRGRFQLLSSNVT